MNHVENENSFIYYLFVPEEQIFSIVVTFVVDWIVTVGVVADKVKTKWEWGREGFKMENIWTQKPYLILLTKIHFQIFIQWITSVLKI